jgi:hypothetical protein
VLALAGLTISIQRTRRHEPILGLVGLSIATVLGALFIFGLPFGYSIFAILLYGIPGLSDFSVYWQTALIVLPGYAAIKRHAPDLKIGRYSSHLLLMVAATLIPSGVSYFHTHWYEGTELITMSDSFSVVSGILAIDLQQQFWTDMTYTSLRIQFGRLLSFGSLETLISLAFIVYIFRFIRGETSHRKALLLGVFTFLPSTIIGIVGTIGNLITVPDHSVFYLPIPLPILFILGWRFMKMHIGYADPPETELPEDSRDENAIIKVPLGIRISSLFRRRDRTPQVTKTDSESSEGESRTD